MYFKLATWDARNICFRDGKNAFESEAAATATASKPGQYRVSRVEASGRVDLEPFTVSGRVAAEARDAGFKGHPTATSLVFGRRLR